MKIVTVKHGDYVIPDDATHLHGVSIQTLVDHFGAELDYVRFVRGQKVFWSIDGRSLEVTIHKASEALPGYWLVMGDNWLAVLAHEKDLKVIEPEEVVS